MSNDGLPHQTTPKRDMFAGTFPARQQTVAWTNLGQVAVPRPQPTSVCVRSIQRFARQPDGAQTTQDG
jgi:hypothetical protein